MKISEVRSRCAKVTPYDAEIILREIEKEVTDVSVVCLLIHDAIKELGCYDQRTICNEIGLGVLHQQLGRKFRLALDDLLSIHMDRYFLEIEIILAYYDFTEDSMGYDTVWKFRRSLAKYIQYLEQRTKNIDLDTFA